MGPSWTHISPIIIFVPVWAQHFWGPFWPICVQLQQWQLGLDPRAGANQAQLLPPTRGLAVEHTPTATGRAARPSTSRRAYRLPPDGDAGDRQRPGRNNEADGRPRHVLEKFGSKAALRYGGINPPLHDRKEHSAAAK